MPALRKEELVPQFLEKMNHMVPRGKKMPRGTCNFGKILHKISV